MVDHFDLAGLLIIPQGKTHMSQNPGKITFIWKKTEKEITTRNAAADL
jgi:hypothetical protein